MKITKNKLNQIIQEEYERMLFEQQPSGVGTWKAQPRRLVDPKTGHLIGSTSKDVADEEARSASLGSFEHSPPGLDPYGRDNPASRADYEAGEEDIGWIDATGAEYPVDSPATNVQGFAPRGSGAYTPSPARGPSFGYTPISAKTDREREHGVRGMQGVGANRRFNESLARQVERYIYKTLRG